MSRLLTEAHGLIRIAGRDEPAHVVVERASREHGAPIVLLAKRQEDDYALIDPALQTSIPGEAEGTAEGEGESGGPIPIGIGYAGMTPAQRGAFLAWLQDPAQAAPTAFQELYVAQLEVRLFEAHGAADAHAALHALQEKQAWQGVESIARAILLGYWLQQDGTGMGRWLTQAALSPRLLSCGLGLQALLQTPLNGAQLSAIGAVWGLHGLADEESVMKTRLISLTTSLGRDPLAVALERLDEDALGPRPWRMAHRGLRVALPQPELRSHLAPLLTDAASVSRPHTAGDESEPRTSDQGGASAGPDAAETIILEFGESRSEYFDYVLHQVRGLDGFNQIMDEDRRLIYRVRFQKGRLRMFWRIWEYVQHWSSTRIYVDGEEIERWKVWPYSQFLR